MKRGKAKRESFHENGKRKKDDKSTIQAIFEADISENPWCDHGPSILFERRNEEKVVRFFACSAFRDRKKCSFYLEESKKKSIIHRKVSASKLLRPLMKPVAFCINCQKLLEQVSGHDDSHDLVTKSLNQASKILKPLDDAKSQAQFHFSNETIGVIVQTILNFSPTLVICLGTPSVFEELISQNTSIKLLLLDIDQRLSMFHSNFCHFNMFNYHFFDEESHELFKKELKKHKKALVITDPPFGGRPEIIQNTLNLMKKDFEANSFDVIWIFPYYMEPQMKAQGYKMSDYQVTYQAESKYRQGHKDQSRRKLGSPVRLFTTLPLISFNLRNLTDEYRLCQTCNKFVSLTNRHCHECGECTAKNGGLYKHCFICSRCVKHSWSHCNQCQRCTLPDHKNCKMDV